MALITVREVTRDADFLDPVLLIHRKPFVDEFGENKLQEQVVNTFGSVQPASGKALKRLPDALQTADVRSFWIQGAIIADGQCAYPDIIVYRGLRYQVQVVFDWLNFGESFAEGLAVRERISA